MFFPRLRLGRGPIYAAVTHCRFKDKRLGSSNALLEVSTLFHQVPGSEGSRSKEKDEGMPSSLAL